MAQHAWSITGPQGRTYNLGLFHGETTHHVVVHCNNSVVAIDFGVRESKTYSLLLDQQLCELTIDHTGGDKFTYDCRLNLEADTPYNKERRAALARTRRLDRLKWAACLSVFLIVIICLVF